MIGDEIKVLKLKSYFRFSLLFVICIWNVLHMAECRDVVGIVYFTRFFFDFSKLN